MNLPNRFSLMTNLELFTNQCSQTQRIAGGGGVLSIQNCARHYNANQIITHNKCAIFMLVLTLFPFCQKPSDNCVTIGPVGLSNHLNHHQHGTRTGAGRWCYEWRKQRWFYLSVCVCVSMHTYAVEVEWTFVHTHTKAHLADSIYGNFFSTLLQNALGLNKHKKHSFISIFPLTIHAQTRVCQTFRVLEKPKPCRRWAFSQRLPAILPTTTRGRAMREWVV